MRPLDAHRWARAMMALVLTAWLGLGQATTAASDPAPESANRSKPAVTLPETAKADVDTLWNKALELEKLRHWSEAIQVYQDALDRWPSRVDMKHRLRLCESHFKLNRRYQDKSFRNVLLRLSNEQALALYDEVLERIEMHYVEPVALEPLVRRGYDNLEVALRDPVFASSLGVVSSSDRINTLRSNLQARRQRIMPRSRDDAKREVLTACQLTTAAANLPATAVILEFVYGACDGLPDDYSCYLTPDRLEDLYAMIDGNFVGLGVELKLAPEGLRLVGVLKGGPASEAGLKVGDRITAIDGVSVKGMDLDAAANRLQGKEGSAVSISLLRADGSTPTLALERRPVEVKSVAEAKIADTATGTGYIQLIGFQKTSTAEIEVAVKDLQKQGMRRLVIDLRGNPGGLLNIAVEIADLFLDQGTIVSTRGRSLGQNAVYRAHANGSWTMPVCILVDHDSASASEILAGALQENGRAVVLGDRSYGKGSVQSIFPLRSAPAGLKLTTAKFYSPRNRAYSEQGVEPDIRVHTAARPRGERYSTEFPMGDPERDPVLRAAIRLATQKS